MSPDRSVPLRAAAIQWKRIMNAPKDSPEIAIYLTGTTYPSIREKHGDFDSWFAREVRKHNGASRIVDVRNESFPDLRTVDGIIITGSPASVYTNPPHWTSSFIGHLQDVLDHNVPTLGVCYGHQVLATAAGADVLPHPESREIGTVQLRLTEQGKRHPLFRGISSPFTVQETHEDVVVRLPDELSVQVLAGNTHNEYQALAYSDTVFGVQFHPEITKDIMADYLHIYGTKMLESGDLTRQQFQSLTESIHDAESGSRVIGNFIDLIRKHRPKNNKYS